MQPCRTLPLLSGIAKLVLHQYPKLVLHQYQSITYQMTVLLQYINLGVGWAHAVLICIITTYIHTYMNNTSNYLLLLSQYYDICM